MSKKQTYYEFFGLPSFEEDPIKIKAAYRSMALKWHPDRNQGNEVEAERMMKQVNEVYKVLSTCKGSYDRHLRNKQGESNTQSSHTSEAFKYNWHKSKPGYSWEEAEENPFSKISEEMMREFSKDKNWYKEYFARSWNDQEKRHRVRKESTEAPQPEGKRTVGSSGLLFQDQAFDVLKGWTWDEFKQAQDIINMNRRRHNTT